MGKEDVTELETNEKNLIHYAIDRIVKEIELRIGHRISETDKKGLSDFIYNGGESKIADIGKDLLKFSNSKNNNIGENNSFRNNTNKLFNNIIMGTTFEVHNGWVEDNLSKFNKSEKNISICLVSL